MWNTVKSDCWTVYFPTGAEVKGNWKADGEWWKRRLKLGWKMGSCMRENWVKQQQGNRGKCRCGNLKMRNETGNECSEKNRIMAKLLICVPLMAKMHPNKDELVSEVAGGCNSALRGRKWTWTETDDNADINKTSINIRVVFRRIFKPQQHTHTGTLQNIHQCWFCVVLNSTEKMRWHFRGSVYFH